MLWQERVLGQILSRLLAVDWGAMLLSTHCLPRCASTLRAAEQEDARLQRWLAHAHCTSTRAVCGAHLPHPGRGVLPRYLPAWCLPEWAACSRMHLLLAVHSLPSSLHGRGTELQPTLLAPLHPCSPPTTWIWRRACGWRTRSKTGSASCCWCRTRRRVPCAGWGVAGILRGALRQLHPACSFSRCHGCSGSFMAHVLVAVCIQSRDRSLPATSIAPQDFLNGVCTNIIHMHQKQLKYYTGGRAL